MNTKNKFINDIDVIDVLIAVWKDKFKILFSVFFCFFVTYGYQHFQPASLFEATTKVQTINSSQFLTIKNFNQYLDTINNYKILRRDSKLSSRPITINYLQDLFIETLQNRKLIEEGIVKFNIVRRDNFKDEKNFRIAVKSFTNEIEIKKLKSDMDDAPPVWEISIVYNDENKWREFVSWIFKNANENVRVTLLKNFEAYIKNEKRYKTYSIKDIEISKKNIVEDYEKQLSKRLIILKEHSKIAKFLNIRKNSDKNFNTESLNFLSREIFYPNVTFAYGYEIIDKIINTLENRKIQEPFIPGLLNLDKEYRKFMQDETINRLEQIFYETNILKPEEFLAVNVDFNSTKFESLNKNFVYLVLSIALGLMIGIIYSIVRLILNQNKD